MQQELPTSQTLIYPELSTLNIYENVYIMKNTYA